MQGGPCGAHPALCDNTRMTTRTRNRSTGSPRISHTAENYLLSLAILQEDGLKPHMSELASYLRRIPEGEALDRHLHRTLEREPRHFGALGGFGQICLRAGDESSALLAFERLLVVDPGLDDVQRAVVALRRKVRHTIH